MPSVKNTETEAAEYRVVGPPGCGKTTWLGDQVQQAVESGMSVLISSLTKAAATEIGGRNLPISFTPWAPCTPTATTPWEGRRSPRGSRPVADLVYRPRAVAAHRRRHVGHSVERTRMIERIVG